MENISNKISKKKVLICDDLASIRKILSNILEKQNFQIFEAENGKQAVEYYMDISPDVVFMDIDMPEMNGIEALEKIKEIDANAKIIMCSSMISQRDIALQKGALDFISKPFMYNRIISAVNRIL